MGYAEYAPYTVLHVTVRVTMRPAAPAKYNFLDPATDQSASTEPRDRPAIFAAPHSFYGRRMRGRVLTQMPRFMPGCEANAMGHWRGRISFQTRPAFPRMLLPLLIARGICVEVLGVDGSASAPFKNIQLLSVQLMTEALDAAPSAELLALKTTVRGLLAYSAAAAIDGREHRAHREPL
jgi:hypothetical protein